MYLCFKASPCKNELDLHENKPRLQAARQNTFANVLPQIEADPVQKRL